jgi:hypothetical protein
MIDFTPVNVGDLVSASVKDLENSGKDFSTSEKYKTEVKIFLDRMKIKEIKSSKTIKMIMYAFDNLRLPVPSEILRIRTQQQINLIAIILKILKKHKKIEELTVATYTFNKKAFNIIKDLICAQKIKKINIFLASSIRFRSENHLNYLINESKKLKNKGFQISFVLAWSHFKITLAKCGNDYYQFEGSMNYSTNNMAEQLVFENNKDMYDFDYNFITKIMQDTKNKALEIIL